MSFWENRIFSGNKRRNKSLVLTFNGVRQRGCKHDHSELLPFKEKCLGGKLVSGLFMGRLDDASKSSALPHFPVHLPIMIFIAKSLIFWGSKCVAQDLSAT